MELAYKDENTMIGVWVEPNRVSYYSTYHIYEFDCTSGEILWEIADKCIVRSSNMDIRYISEENNGEKYDLTLVTIGATVIGIRDGEIWAEYVYDHEVVGKIGYGLSEVHITKDGGIYRVNWAGPIALTTEYNTSTLKLGQILETEEIQDGGIVVFPSSQGNTLYIYGRVEDTDYRKVENSEEAMSITYTPDGRYRIAYDSPEDYHYVFNVWDMYTEKNIYRKEFLYNYEEGQGEYFKGCGSIGNEYFYYYTKECISVYNIETLEEKIFYTYRPSEDIYFSSIGTVCSVVGENPGLFFDNGANDVYFLSLETGTAEQILEHEYIEKLYQQNQEDYVHINLEYTANPTGDYLLFCNDSYEVESDELEIRIWDVNDTKICGNFKISGDSVSSWNSEFQLEFSEDGKLMLFQNREHGLQIINLEDQSIETLPFDDPNNQKFWFSKDCRYIFTYTCDYFLKVYDRETKKITTNLECTALTMGDWYFEGEDLRYTANYSESQPALYSLRSIGEGVYECYSVITNCEHVINGRAYVRPGSDSTIYSYPFRTLDEMITMAREILDGRELTDIERQRYSIEN